MELTMENNEAITKENTSSGVIHVLYLFFVTFLLSFTIYADAATITRAAKDIDGKRIKGVLIEGEIEKGDYDKLYDLLKEMGPSWSRIYIASPGGDVAEAIKIGVLVRKLLLSVYVPKFWMGGPEVDEFNRQCSSACFFIYVAGIYRSGDKIGIHRPSLTVGRLIDISLSEASNKNLKIRSVISAYLGSMGVPLKYTDQMFKIDHDDVEFLNFKDLDDFRGYDASVNEWLEARCEKLTPLEDDLRMTLGGKGEKRSSSEDAFYGLLIKKAHEYIRCKHKSAVLASQDAWVDMFVGDDKESYEKAASLFHFGYGTLKDRPRALAYYEKASNKGSGQSMFWMGNAYKQTNSLYSQGFGVDIDYKLAIKWYKKGIKVNNLSSMFALADMYAEGAGVKKDIKKAIELYEEAIQFENNREKECLKEKAINNNVHCVNLTAFHIDDLNALKDKLNN
jgi:hypothetical protein